MSSNILFCSAGGEKKQTNIHINNENKNLELSSEAGRDRKTKCTCQEDERGNETEHSVGIFSVKFSEIQRFNDESFKVKMAK